MITEGRLPMNAEESAAVEKLAGEHEGHDGHLSITRRDPGDTGPLLVHIEGNTWEIYEDGKRKKVA